MSAPMIKFHRSNFVDEAFKKSTYENQRLVEPVETRSLWAEKVSMGLPWGWRANRLGASSGYYDCPATSG